MTVIIERDDELVHWKAVQLNGTVENRNAGSEFDRAAVPGDGLGGRIERYAVLVRVDGGGSGVRYEFAGRVIEEITDSGERDEHLQIAVTVRHHGGPSYSVTCERRVAGAASKSTAIYLPFGESAFRALGCSPSDARHTAKHRVYHT